MTTVYFPRKIDCVSEGRKGEEKPEMRFIGNNIINVQTDKATLRTETEWMGLFIRLLGCATEVQCGGGGGPTGLWQTFTVISFLQTRDRARTRIIDVQ